MEVLKIAEEEAPINPRISMKEQLQTDEGECDNENRVFSQWTKNFTNVQDFGFPELFNYLVGKDNVYNSEGLKSYKSLLGYKLFFDGHMEELCYHPPQPNSNYSYFKFAVEPTEKSKTDDGSATYRGFFILKKDGSVN